MTAANWSRSPRRTGIAAATGQGAAAAAIPSAITASDRFLSAWKCLESELGKRYREARPEGRARVEVVPLLRWAGRTLLLSPTAVDFALQCRDARNAYAHVSFEGYDGPVTNPPIEIIHRLERIGSALRHPARLHGFAPVAVTCDAESRLDHALVTMRQHDFSQLPYRHPVYGWLLVTREQVSRWLEVEADADGTVLVDLGVTVASLADDSRVGLVRPRTLAADATVSAALEQLEIALRTPDSAEGGYASILVEPHPTQDAPRVLTADDLPNMYDLLGR